MPGHRKRRQFKQTDAFTRSMVIGLKRAGWSIRQIAADTHLGASTVHRLWRRWLEQGNVAIYRNVGATRVTSARVDRRILRQAVAVPQATFTAILQHVQGTLDHSISTRTISRRLVANGLHSCRPLRRLPLTPPNRRQRLEWCRARSTWMTEWHRVVFSDESRFCLSSDSLRVRVWRRRGERSNPAAIVERPTVRQRGIMVWGAIAYDSRSPLLRIQGTMTAQRYVDVVLRPVTLPYLQGVPNALYQQDNARPHTARISQQALQDVQMLPWPLFSPDLSPIEHVWDIIGRRLHALPQPRSEDELEIGSRVGRNQTTVMRICDRWMQEGTTDRRVRSHPPQCTTSRGDRQNVRMAVTDRSVTSRTVAQHIQRLRRQWCDERRMWTAEWNEIVFTDDCWVRVWRHRGERMLNSCVMHRHTGSAPGIRVWGGIGYHSRTPLVRIAGTLNSQRYISEVLEPVVHPYLQDLPTAIFQQDNARPHVARIVQGFFVIRQIQLPSWPVRSPDLSPIESMWSMVAQRLTHITSPAATPDQLWKRVEAAWSALPQEHIQSIFESMPRHVAAVISSNGGYSGY
ncbi:GIGYF1 [Cordylochernes scorpioides]|uniref:GIGYF1 n=1 Tax=Cordylochernes scorpioides TaxID=51811 RepID=A0ABY6L532_9ARAC|nr:GIGYF1 [Cordylochernes scorpioides]